jgi:hypothetical protein
MAAADPRDFNQPQKWPRAATAAVALGGAGRQAAGNCRRGEIHPQYAIFILDPATKPPDFTFPEDVLT